MPVIQTKKLTVFTLVLILSILLVPATAFSADLTETQLTQEIHAVSNLNNYYGSDRFETAAAVCRSGWEKADTVVLARSDDFADALAGVPLANKLNAPILLTLTANLPEADIQEIQRLQAKKVIILGGTGAISEIVVNELEKLGIIVERISGSDRFGTAAEIAARVMSAETNTAVIVNGYNFPDALSVASYAAAKGYPILMTENDDIPANTDAALARHNIRNTFVIGWTGAIGEKVYGELPAPVRLGGADRYATAVEVANHFAVSPQEIFIATGLDFPDAITGAVLAARHNTGILYVPGMLQAGPYADEGVLQFIIRNKIQTISVLGGPGVVNDVTVTNLLYPSKTVNYNGLNNAAENMVNSVNNLEDVQDTDVAFDGKGYGEGYQARLRDMENCREQIRINTQETTRLRTQIRDYSEELRLKIQTRLQIRENITAEQMNRIQAGIQMLQQEREQIMLQHQGKIQEQVQMMNQARLQADIEDANSAMNNIRTEQQLRITTMTRVMQQMQDLLANL